MVQSQYMENKPHRVLYVPRIKFAGLLNTLWSINCGSI